MVPPHVVSLEPEYLLEQKSKMISAIGSRESLLPLHRKRSAFLDFLQEEFSSEIDIYGKGRKYIESKSEGLSKYRYSIAIENSQTPGYWTEKISDCFISLTVPIYVGAPDIGRFFPPQSIISLSLEDLRNNPQDLFLRISEQDYEERLPYLLEARDTAMGEFSFGFQLGKLLLEATSGSNSKRRRAFRVWTLDTFISHICGVLARLYSLIVRAKRGHEKTSN